MVIRRWISRVFVALGLLLSACIVLPRSATRQDIHLWIAGMDLQSISAVTTCIKGYDECEKPLPRAHWPRMLELIKDLKQEKSADPGSWDLKGRLYISYGAGPRLEIDLDAWPAPAEGPVVAWVHGGSGQKRYNAFDGEELWAWLSAATQEVRAGTAGAETVTGREDG